MCIRIYMPSVCKDDSRTQFLSGPPNLMTPGLQGQEDSSSPTARELRAGQGTHTSSTLKVSTAQPRGGGDITMTLRILEVSAL